MLRVVGSVSADDCWIVMDEYVPLRLRCSHKPDVPIYWRTGNFDTSLLEVGLHPDTGAICTVTVTGTDLFDPSGFRVMPNATSASAMSRIRGMPICNIAGWPSDPFIERFRDRFKDEPGPFTVTVGRNNIVVWLGPETPLSVMYESKAMTVGVNASDEICYLLFEGISSHDIDQLCQLVQRIKEAMVDTSPLPSQPNRGVYPGQP